MTDSKSERKVLRIGIIQGGKIIEERTLKKRETITVGQTAKSMFSVSSPSLPKHHELFELAGGEYHLRFLPGMGGVIQLRDGDVKDLAKLHGAPGIDKRGDASSLKLNDTSRGKVKMGDVTVLFQFRDPPAAPGKMVLPSEARGGLISNIDVQFSSILVAVSIITTSLAAYSRTVPYVEPTTIEEIGQRYQKMIMPDRDPAPPEPVQEQGEDEKAKEKEKDKGKDKEKKKAKPKGKAKKPKSAAELEAAANARKERMKKKVAGKGLLGVIGTKAKGKGALADVFSDGGFGEGDLGDAFSGIQGVDIADSGAKGTRGGGSGEAASLGTLATEGGGSVDVGGKTETAVRGNVGAETPEVEGDLSPAVIKKEMRRRMRAIKDCYERQLKRFPDLSGKIVISFEILETGKIAEINIEEDSVGNAKVKSCILSRAKRWRFPKPDGGSVYVAFPLVFTPAG